MLMDEVRRTRRWWQLPFLRRLAHRGRGPFTIGIGALALVLIGGGASAYVAFRPVENETSVRCFAAADPSGRSHSPEVSLIGTEQETDSEPLPIDDPIAQCEVLWRNGILQPDDSPTHATHDPVPSDDPSGAVPGLVACTLDEGIAGVFPGDTSTCEQLGLPRTTR